MSKLPRIFTPISQTSYSNDYANAETLSSNGQNLLTHTDSYKNSLKPFLSSVEYRTIFLLLLYNLFISS